MTTKFKHPYLLNSEDKRNYVQHLAEQIDTAGGLFRPESQWFNQPPTVEHLSKLVKELCRWLGCKPRQLDVRYSNELGSSAGNYTEDKAGHHIIINQRYADQSYQAIAVLAHGLTHYVVSSRWHVALAESADQEELVDLASIYLGFGTLIINGLDRHESWAQRFGAQITGERQRLTLGSLSPAEYARQLGHQVASSPKTNEEQLYSQLAPWSRRLFNTRPPKHVKTAFFVKQADRRILQGNSVFIATLVAAVLVLSLTAYVLEQRPRGLPAQLALAKEQADNLYADYVLCQQTLTNQEATLQSADILEQEDINATSNRCLSIGNEYNAVAKTYNQALPGQ